MQKLKVLPTPFSRPDFSQGWGCVYTTLLKMSNVVKHRRSSHVKPTFHRSRHVHDHGGRQNNGRSGGVVEFCSFGGTFLTWLRHIPDIISTYRAWARLKCRFWGWVYNILPAQSRYLAAHSRNNAVILPTRSRHNGQTNPMDLAINFGQTFVVYSR